MTYPSSFNQAVADIQPEQFGDGQISCWGGRFACFVDIMSRSNSVLSSYYQTDTVWRLIQNDTKHRKFRWQEKKQTKLFESKVLSEQIHHQVWKCQKRKNTKSNLLQYMFIKLPSNIASFFSLALKSIPICFSYSLYIQMIQHDFDPFQHGHNPRPYTI